MNRPARFLVALGRALSSGHLYPANHPARTVAVEDAFAALEALLEVDRRPAFTFLDDAVMYGDSTLDDLRNWAAADRLVLAGMQRIEIRWPVPRAEFLAFLAGAAGGVAGSGAGGAAGAADEDPHPSIRYGTAAVTVYAVKDSGAADDVLAVEETVEAELEAMRVVLRGVADGRIERFEVETIVGSLLLGLASAQTFMAPLVRLRQADEYTTAHSLNVASLTMALAQYAGYTADQVRAVGVAGVLHDIGKVLVPREVLNRNGPLTAEERALVERHPVDGARMILESGDAGLELAAIVAYEHHMRYDGGGYPQPSRRRACHPASDLLHVCDVYDAMATHRPYRAAWPEPKILQMIEDEAGTQFEPASARLFLEMMRSLQGRVRVLSDAGADAGSV